MFWMIFVTAVAILVTALVFWASASSRFDGRSHVVRGLIIATLFWVLIARTFAHIFVNWSIFSPITTWWVILLLVAFLVAAFFLGGWGLTGLAIGAVVVAMLIAVLAPQYGSTSNGAATKSAAQVACEKQQGHYLSDTSGTYSCWITQVKQAPILQKQVAANCLGGHNVLLDTNTGNKIMAGGVSANPKQAVTDIMVGAAHDPRVFQLYWNGTTKTTPLVKAFGPIQDVNSLIDAKTGCYTQQAALWYERLLGTYKTASTVRTTIPANYTNTGASPKGSVFQEAGVSGTPATRVGYKTTFLNGDVVYFLQRCGNLAAPAPIVTLPVKPALSPSSPGTASRPGTPGISTPGTSSPQSPPGVTQPKAPVVTPPKAPPIVTPPQAPTPPGVKVCYKASPGCGPNGVNAPPVQSGNPGGTKGYTPGTAEKVTGAQQAPVNPYQPNPTYGSNPPAGSVSPPGADNGVPSGTSGGVSAPSGTPNPGGAVAQPSTPPSGTSSGSTGNPCEDPNAAGCGH